MEQTESTGSDHYPVYCKINIATVQTTEGRGGKWISEKANWENFMRECDKYFLQIRDHMDMEGVDCKIKQGIIAAAESSIPKSKGGMRKNPIPWWDDKCKQAIKDRNKAFRLVKRSHHFQHLVQYKQAQAVVRKTIRQAKRTYWRKFCSSIGNNTQVGEVWGMIKKMGGDRRDWSYPVLSSGEGIAISDKEKAKLMVSSFVAIHSSNNLTEEGRRGRERTKDENREALKRKSGRESELDLPFTIGELRKALAKTGKSATGKDEISYIMIKHISEGGLYKLLALFNKGWREGRIPMSWKEAIIIPIRKPGKDPSKPTNYRPIALTSHICK